MVDFTLLIQAGYKFFWALLHYPTVYPYCND
jgi:hypothetical protein